MPVLNRAVLESNIKTLLTAQKLTQKNVAGRLNMSQGNFNKKVKGDIQFTLEEIFQLADIFKVPVEALWSEKGVSSTTDEKTDSKTPTTDELHPRVPLIEEKVCKALAEVFKYASVRSIEIEHQEEVYEETRDEYGRYTGMFERKYVGDKKDPINKYSAFFFPHYYELAKTFTDDDEWADYITELQYGGNFIESNWLINRFLKQLISLSTTYDNDNMTREAYIFAVNSALEKALSEIRQK